jgi:hypothetical protein
MMHLLTRATYRNRPARISARPDTYACSVEVQCISTEEFRDLVIVRRWGSCGEKEGNVERRRKIDATAMYIAVLLLVLFWCVSFSSFIRKIDKNYLHTFFGTMTGSQYAIHLFRTGTTDFMKMDAVFSTNVLLWDSIRDEVIAYTHANWARWIAEKPDWFTEHFIATIPDEFIPRADPNRKRSSVLRNLFGLPDADTTYATISTKASKVAAE